MPLLWQRRGAVTSARPRPSFGDSLRSSGSCWMRQTSRLASRRAGARISRASLPRSGRARFDEIREKEGPAVTLEPQLITLRSSGIAPAVQTPPLARREDLRARVGPDLYIPVYCRVS